MTTRHCPYYVCVCLRTLRTILFCSDLRSDNIYRLLRLSLIENTLRKRHGDIINVYVQQIRWKETLLENSTRRHHTEWGGGDSKIGGQLVQHGFTYVSIPRLNNAPHIIIIYCLKQLLLFPKRVLQTDQKTIVENRRTCLNLYTSHIIFEIWQRLYSTSGISSLVSAVFNLDFCWDVIIQFFDPYKRMFVVYRDLGLQLILGKNISSVMIRKFSNLTTLTYVIISE